MTKYWLHFVCNYIRFINFYVINMLTGLVRPHPFIDRSFQSKRGISLCAHVSTVEFARGAQLKTRGDASVITSFHPERVLFRPGGVNLRAYLCGVPLPPKGGKRNDQIMYASAQALDFLARAKNPSFPNRNLAGRGICPGVSGWTLTSVHPETPVLIFVRLAQALTL